MTYFHEKPRSVGGEILSTRDTELYSTGASMFNLFSTPRCQQQNTPRAVIQTGVLPGECWAFKGSSGSVVIRLLGHVHVSGISLEHISSLISPTGETDTAPRDFSVWGQTDLEDKIPFLFGKFTYHNTGPPLQYFEVQVKHFMQLFLIKYSSSKLNSFATEAAYVHFQNCSLISQNGAYTECKLIRAYSLSLSSQM
ncbi:PREDICTED: SUN domain-containing protein 1-like [Dinoponera quadriceps]|uniref:SUN domain-containing protein 1-like n=1 Tax=Dinoponera quadriceps TaxID=609295 RepID=A0A6P3XCE2_DINQU|nr:PREDICTED: SUN domain-containing protein 1-like [Dinoponera quadriceps]